MKNDNIVGAMSLSPNFVLLACHYTYKATARVAATIILVILFMPILVNADVHISGENNLTYTYSTEEESIDHYLENELSMRVDYRVFSFGMTFLAGLPKHDSFDAIESLQPDQITTEWRDRFVQLNFDNFRLKAGTIEEAFGAGLALRAWNNKDLDRDMRLEGAQIHYRFNNFRIAGVYGALRDDIEIDEDFSEYNINQNDLVIGLDVGFRPTPELSLGGSMVQYKQKHVDNIGRISYLDWNVFSGRLGYMHDMFDINAEFAELQRQMHDDSTQYGTAFYTTRSVYFNTLFTLSGGYKRYERYRFSLADLPTLNHYDELWMSYDNKIDFEEGIEGGIRFTPNFDNEFQFRYAESWNRNFSVRHHNFFAQYKRGFETFSLTFEYEHLERIKSHDHEWEKMLRPAVKVDLFSLARPISIAFLWKYEEEEVMGIEESKHTPYLQFETRLTDRLSIALFGEYEIDDWDNIGKNQVYIGTEIVTSIANHTELILFMGQEKGGNVCRNGVCRPQQPFEGIRLTLSTRF